MTALMIAAAHKSSGKTTFTMGLGAALSARGLSVQPYKKGPDYIDPAWLGEATRRTCINLDFYTMTAAEIHSRFAAYGADADICLIEANKGLYDGLAVDGSDSNAALAGLLRIPVLLVIDCQGMTRGIAPLLLGYQAFADDGDAPIDIIGVILNQIGGSRHEAKLRAAIERYSELPVLGAIHKDSAMGVAERHLGLIPSNEQAGAHATIRYIADRVAAQVDIDRILERTARLRHRRRAEYRLADNPAGVRIGVARDAAFGFYYPDDLDELRASGAELIDFRPTESTSLPDVDALFIGGGFPETHLQSLQRNVELRRDIRRFVERGKPVYAECGGLMYLSRSLRWHDQQAEMVGALPLDIAMHERPQGRGYVKLAETNRFPWPTVASANRHEICAHEFHYSGVEQIDPSIEFAYLVKRGSGIDGKHDGVLFRNVLASYAHQRHTERNPWTTRFVQHIQSGMT